MRRAPCRRARSAARSRACQVGDRSSFSASEPSSTTTIAARSGTGASTADRPPRTTQAPRRVRSHARARSRGRPSVSQGTTVGAGRPQRGGQPAEPPVRDDDDRRPRLRPAARRRARRTSTAGGQRTTATGRRGSVRRHLVRCRDEVLRSRARSEPVSGVKTCPELWTGPGATTAAGEAARSSGSRGPAKRQAAHSVSVDDLRGRAGGDGGQERSELLGRRLRDDVVFDHPGPDPAAAEVDPHDRADADDRGQRLRHRVVEEALDGEDVDRDPADAGRGHRSVDERRQPPAALRSVSAMSSTCSQVNSLSGRPKCP